MNSRPSKNIEYKDILDEEIKNFLEVESFNQTESDKYKISNGLKRTPLEIINRILFLLFIGSFMYSFMSIYFINKIWFIFYVMSTFSCIFYTPNRKALKELIAAWPNLEDIIKGRRLR